MAPACQKRLRLTGSHISHPQLKAPSVFCSRSCLQLDVTYNQGFFFSRVREDIFQQDFSHFRDVIKNTAVVSIMIHQACSILFGILLQLEYQPVLFFSFCAKKRNSGHARNWSRASRTRVLYTCYSTIIEEFSQTNWENSFFQEDSRNAYGMPYTFLG